MNGGKRSAGYTIVEVMIVLAISGLMFTIAANFISGKQQKTAFRQGVNEMASRMQGLIDQVADGQYSDVSQQCTFSGTNTSVSAGANEQGKNPQCVFLGKIMHLRLFDKPTEYEIVSLAGGRIDATGKPITSLSAADPTVIDGLTTVQTVPQSLDITNVKLIDGSGSPVANFTIGFLQSQGSTDNVGTLRSGAQTISMYFVNGLAVNAPLTSSNNLTLSPARAATICITDDAQYARVKLGSSGSQLKVTVKMDGTTENLECQ